MPGPAPKHPSERRRRNLAPALRQLPAEGRKGSAPAWPIPGKMQKGELDMWRRLWATPQAAAWEQLSWTVTIARYCRMLVEANAPKASASSRSEARQLEDRIGLTAMSMKRLGWEIVADELAEQRASGLILPEVPTAGARERLRAVDATAVGK